MAENEDETQDLTYDLDAVDPDDIPKEWQGGAIYTLEQAVRCPHCREPIRTLRVVRMLRTQVTFTSPLPRAGRALICPQCERIVSAELSGIL